MRWLERMARTRPIDLGGPSAAALVCGTSRSGTTWVADLANAAAGRRLIFEPFHPQHVPDSAPLGWCRYLRPDAPEGPLDAIVDAALAGRLRSPWSDAHNRRFVSRSRLVKATRANLLLARIARRHPDLPIVLVVRHPLAVAWSTTRLGWPVSLRTYLDQPDLVADHLAPFEDLLTELEQRGDGSPESAFERNVAAWCIQQRVPLQDLPPGRVHVTFYEDLVRHPEAEIAAVCRHLGSTPPAHRHWRRPSHTATPASAVVTSADPLAVWTADLPPGWSRRGEAIVAGLGLAHLYDGLVPVRRSGPPHL